MTEKENRWKTVSIPTGVWEKAKEIVESGDLDMYHISSELIIDSARRRMEEPDKIKIAGEEYNLEEEDVQHMAKLEHTNITVNGAGQTIIAIRDHEDNHIYDVYISKTERIY